MTDDIDKKTDLDDADLETDDVHEKADPDDADLETDDIDKKADLDDADLEKVIAAAEAKQERYRLDEYIAITLGITSVLILWLLQWLGLY
jgi:hypothetical protein